jgi:prevent-host-death family protein
VQLDIFRIAVHLAGMTRSCDPKTSIPPRWTLQDARARFGVLVRCAGSDGPQIVTVHGRDAVVVIDADEFRRLQAQRSGALLVAAMQASPHRAIELAPTRRPMPVRRVEL